MIEKELIKIWQSSTEVERVKFKRSRLMIDLQSSFDRLHKSIKYRDLIEIITAIVMILIFGYITYTVPFVLSKIAAIFIILWLIYVIFRLRSSKKLKPSAVTESYLDYLYKTKEYLRIQKKLLDSVLYWYILPPFIGIIVFLSGIWIIPETHNTIIMTAVGTVGYGIFAYLLNKRKVKKEIIPRLRKTDELIKVMKE
ncbi:hypothetical protein BMS3Abin04_02215 [bacterium BMS3Abin04]|nr:hypothetical protein BMS3Abin04_02215 [bacterium BMS3Abin04]